MTRFLVEAYTPETAAAAEIEARVRAAADELSQAGTPIRYERAIFVPEDEVCFHLLDGPSAGVVGEAIRRAGISPQRIVEAAP